MTIPSLSLVIINPSWLRVDSAMIFFTSMAVVAHCPAMAMVIVLEMSKVELNDLNRESDGYMRMRRKTPAVTSVEEWTRALTGVGAAMASGSHALKGSWALFVKAANVISVAMVEVRGMLIMVQCP